MLSSYWYRLHLKNVEVRIDEMIISVINSRV